VQRNFTFSVHILITRCEIYDRLSGITPLAHHGIWRKWKVELLMVQQLILQEGSQYS